MFILMTHVSSLRSFNNYSVSLILLKYGTRYVFYIFIGSSKNSSYIYTTLFKYSNFIKAVPNLVGAINYFDYKDYSKQLFLYTKATN